jgi:hypothetical protein
MCPVRADQRKAETHSGISTFSGGAVNLTAVGVISLGLKLMAVVV